TDAEGRGDGLWGDYTTIGGGVLLSKGRIGEAGGSDLGTVANGLYDRHSYRSGIRSSQPLDEVVARKQASASGYNELVVNQPEAVGYFKPCGRDEKGALWANPNTKRRLEDLHEEYKHALTHDRYPINLDRFKKSIEDYRAR